MDAYEPPLAPVEPVKKPHGCFFYGCITAICLSLLFIVVAGLLTYRVYRYYTQMIAEYTSTTPIQLPHVELPADQAEALDARVAAFKKALETGEGAGPLVLTADEINALIAKNPTFKDRVHVEIPGDQIQGQISMPLGQLGLPGLAGRYLNGKAAFHVLLDDGQLYVTLRSLEVNGKALPEDVLKEFRKQNLAADFANDPNNAKAIQKLESIEVKDGKLIIKPRTKKDAAEEKAKEPGASKEPSKSDEPQAAPKEEPKIEAPAKPKDEKAPE